MKSIKQLLRQPLKSLAGILLIWVAVSILTISVGQYIATSLTRNNLENNYTTVALTTEKYKYDSERNITYLELPAQITDWINRTSSQFPDVMKTISYTGKLSAYIPQLTPDNYTQYKDAPAGGADGVTGEPYSCAILEITLNEIGTEIQNNMHQQWINGTDQSYRESVSIVCRGRIDRVIALQEGYPDPTGYNIDVTFRVWDEAALEALDLEVGQRYLIYGMDYFDQDWFLRTLISETQLNFQQPFDLNKVYDYQPNLSDGEMGSVSYYPDENGNMIQEITNWNYYENTIGALDRERTYYKAFDADNIRYANSCRLTVYDPSALPWTYPTDRFPYYSVSYSERSYHTCRDASEFLGTGFHVVSVEDYIEDYAVPTYVRLDGTVEEFLASEDGILWQQVIEDMEINNHSFPVLAVEKIGYQPDFARQMVRIVEGRDFTESELINGEKVCVISQTIAVESGLEVGDTISIQTYPTDYNLYPYKEKKTIFYSPPAYPSAAFYSRAMGFDGEMEVYTIVGLYRHQSNWYGSSSYGFTPNTVFIPKASTAGTMELDTDGIYKSYILENGKIEEFLKIVDNAGYHGLFSCYDQGYTRMKSGLDAYAEVSIRALYVGFVAYCVILLLFMLLFPIHQREILSAMRSLGADRQMRISHVIVSSIGLLIPGSFLGLISSYLLWEHVTTILTKSVETSVSLTASTTVLILIAVLQLFAALLAVFITALTMTRETGGKK